MMTATDPLALGRWAADANCAGVGSHPFYDWETARPGPAADRLLSAALELCANCTVQTDCLTHALHTPSGNDYGVWGGTTRRQRLRLRLREARV